MNTISCFTISSSFALRRRAKRLLDLDYTYIREIASARHHERCVSRVVGRDGEYEACAGECVLVAQERVPLDREESVRSGLLGKRRLAAVGDPAPNAQLVPARVFAVRHDAWV
jgi:hypothetical protein